MTLYFLIDTCFVVFTTNYIDPSSGRVGAQQQQLRGSLVAPRGPDPRGVKLHPREPAARRGGDVASRRE